MLQVWLSPEDGGTAWRHALGAGEARAGWEFAGPLGLLRRIGTQLGHRLEPALAADRVAALSNRLGVHDDGARSYSRSRKLDRFGIAAYLLSLRDELKLAGWRGQALAGSRRLADLAALEALSHALPPGLPDLLGEALAAVRAAHRLPQPLEITLTAPAEAYPPLMLELLEALRDAGCSVSSLPLGEKAHASEETDLGRLQRALISFEVSVWLR